MESPLWIDQYQPTLEELPQDGVRETLQHAITDPINLIIQGPIGCGKTAAVKALAKEAHGDPENDLVIINVADFFGMTKDELSNDPRFTTFISSQRKRTSSKADLINHVLKESASYPPVSGDYKTLLLDNAEAIREDFQQALRRVMEQYYEATQFIITTRQPSKLIPAIRSRCFQVPMRSPTTDEIVSVLQTILDTEGVEYDKEGLEYIAGYTNGNLRKAITSAQAVTEDVETITMNTAYEVLSETGRDEMIATMLEKAEDGEFTDARSILDDLLIDEGLEGQEVLEEILSIAQTRYANDNLASVYKQAGEIDMDLVHGTNA
ncbi:MAG: AAA family ATPase, partial [Halobacteriaceae archaeon]